MSAESLSNAGGEHALSVALSAHDFDVQSPSNPLRTVGSAEEDIHQKAAEFAAPSPIADQPAALAQRPVSASTHGHRPSCVKSKAEEEVRASLEQSRKEFERMGILTAKNHGGTTPVRASRLNSSVAEDHASAKALSVGGGEEIAPARGVNANPQQTATTASKPKTGAASLLAALSKKNASSAASASSLSPSVTTPRKAPSAPSGAAPPATAAKEGAAEPQSLPAAATATAENITAVKGSVPQPTEKASELKNLSASTEKSLSSSVAPSTPRALVPIVPPISAPSVIPSPPPKSSPRRPPASNASSSAQGMAVSQSPSAAAAQQKRRSSVMAVSASSPQAVPSTTATAVNAAAGDEAPASFVGVNSNVDMATEAKYQRYLERMGFTNVLPNRRVSQSSRTRRIDSFLEVFSGDDALDKDQLAQFKGSACHFTGSLANVYSIVEQAVCGIAAKDAEALVDEVSAALKHQSISPSSGIIAGPASPMPFSPMEDDDKGPAKVSAPLPTGAKTADSRNRKVIVIDPSQVGASVAAAAKNELKAAVSPLLLSVLEMLKNALSATSSIDCTVVAMPDNIKDPNPPKGQEGRTMEFSGAVIIFFELSGLIPPPLREFVDLLTKVSKQGPKPPPKASALISKALGLEMFDKALFIAAVTPAAAATFAQQDEEAANVQKGPAMENNVVHEQTPPVDDALDDAVTALIVEAQSRSNTNNSVFLHEDTQVVNTLEAFAESSLEDEDDDGDDDDDDNTLRKKASVSKWRATAQKKKAPKPGPKHSALFNFSISFSFDAHPLKPLMDNDCPPRIHLAASMSNLKDIGALFERFVSSFTTTDKLRSIIESAIGQAKIRSDGSSATQQFMGAGQEVMADNAMKRQLDFEARLVPPPGRQWTILGGVLQIHNIKFELGVDVAHRSFIFKFDASTTIRLFKDSDDRGNSSSSSGTASGLAASALFIVPSRIFGWITKSGSFEFCCDATDIRIAGLTIPSSSLVIERKFERNSASVQQQLSSAGRPNATGDGPDAQWIIRGHISIDVPKQPEVQRMGIAEALKLDKIGMVKSSSTPPAAEGSSADGDSGSGGSTRAKKMTLVAHGTYNSTAKAFEEFCVNIPQFSMQDVKSLLALVLTKSNPDIDSLGVGDDEAETSSRINQIVERLQLPEVVSKRVIRDFSLRYSKEGVQVDCNVDGWELPDKEKDKLAKKFDVKGVMTKVGAAAGFDMGAAEATHLTESFAAFKRRQDSLIEADSIIAQAAKSAKNMSKEEGEKLKARAKAEAERIREAAIERRCSFGVVNDCFTFKCRIPLAFLNVEAHFHAIAEIQKYVTAEWFAIDLSIPLTDILATKAHSEPLRNFGKSFAGAFAKVGASKHSANDADTQDDGHADAAESGEGAVVAGKNNNDVKASLTATLKGLTFQEGGSDNFELLNSISRLIELKKVDVVVRPFGKETAFLDIYMKTALVKFSGIDPKLHFLDTEFSEVRVSYAKKPTSYNVVVGSSKDSDFDFDGIPKSTTTVREIPAGLVIECQFTNAPIQKIFGPKCVVKLKYSKQPNSGDCGSFNVELEGSDSKLPDLIQYEDAKTKAQLRILMGKKEHNYMYGIQFHLERYFNLFESPVNTPEIEEKKKNGEVIAANALYNYRGELWMTIGLAETGSWDLGGRISSSEIEKIPIGRLRWKEATVTGYITFDFPKPVDFKLRLGCTFGFHRQKTAIVKDNAVKIIADSKEARFEGCICMSTGSPYPSIWFMGSDVLFSDFINIPRDIMRLEPMKSTILEQIDSNFAIHNFLVAFAPAGASMDLPSFGGQASEGLLGPGAVLYGDMTVLGNRFVGKFLVSSTLVHLKVDVQKPWTIMKTILMTSVNDRERGPSVQFRLNAKNPKDFYFEFDCRLIIIPKSLEAGAIVKFGPHGFEATLAVTILHINVSVQIVIAPKMVRVALEISQERQNEIKDAFEKELMDVLQQSARKYKAAGIEAMLCFQSAIKAGVVAEKEKNDVRREGKEVRALDKIIKQQLFEDTSAIQKWMEQFNVFYNGDNVTVMQVAEELSRLVGILDKQLEGFEKSLSDKKKEVGDVERELVEAVDAQAVVEDLLKKAEEQVGICKAALDKATEAVRQKREEAEPPSESKGGVISAMFEAVSTSRRMGQAQREMAKKMIKEALVNYESAQKSLGLAQKEWDAKDAEVKQKKQSIDTLTADLTIKHAAIVELESDIEIFRGLLGEFKGLLNSDAIFQQDTISKTIKELTQAREEAIERLKQTKMEAARCKLNPFKRAAVKWKREQVMVVTPLVELLSSRVDSIDDWVEALSEQVYEVYMEHVSDVREHREVIEAQRAAEVAAAAEAAGAAAANGGTSLGARGLPSCSDFPPPTQLRSRGGTAHAAGRAGLGERRGSHHQHHDDPARHVDGAPAALGGRPSPTGKGDGHTARRRFKTPPPPRILSSIDTMRTTSLPVLKAGATALKDALARTAITQKQCVALEEFRTAGVPAIVKLAATVEGMRAELDEVRFVYLQGDMKGRERTVDAKGRETLEEIIAAVEEIANVKANKIAAQAKSLKETVLSGLLSSLMGSAAPSSSATPAGGIAAPPTAAAQAKLNAALSGISPELVQQLVNQLGAADEEISRTSLFATFDLCGTDGKPKPTAQQRAAGASTSSVAGGDPSGLNDDAFEANEDEDDSAAYDEKDRQRKAFHPDVLAIFTEAERIHREDLGGEGPTDPTGLSRSSLHRSSAATSHGQFLQQSFAEQDLQSIEQQLSRALAQRDMTIVAYREDLKKANAKAMNGEVTLAEATGNISSHFEPPSDGVTDPLHFDGGVSGEDLLNTSQAPSLGNASTAVSENTRRQRNLKKNAKEPPTLSSSRGSRGKHNKAGAMRVDGAFDTFMSVHVFEVINKIVARVQNMLNDADYNLDCYPAEYDDDAVAAASGGVDATLTSIAKKNKKGEEALLGSETTGATDTVAKAKALATQQLSPFDALHREEEEANKKAAEKKKKSKGKKSKKEKRIVTASDGSQIELNGNDSEDDDEGEEAAALLGDGGSAFSRALMDSIDEVDGASKRLAAYQEALTTIAESQKSLISVFISKDSPLRIEGEISAENGVRFGISGTITLSVNVNETFRFQRDIVFTNTPINFSAITEVIRSFFVDSAKEAPANLSARKVGGAGAARGMAEKVFSGCCK